MKSQDMENVCNIVRPIRKKRMPRRDGDEEYGVRRSVNSLNDSGEFQEVESNYSGRLSHVSSQPAMIPSSRSMLSRDKRLPLDTWNTSGLQEKVFGKQFSQGQGHYSPGASQRERGSVPQPSGSDTFFFHKMTNKNGGTIPMSTFAGRPSTVSSLIPVEYQQISMVGQQRLQISELQFDKIS